MLSFRRNLLIFLIIIRNVLQCVSILSPIPNSKLVYRTAKLVSTSDRECADYPDKSYSLCGPGCQGLIYCDKGQKLNFTSCPSLRPYCQPSTGLCGSALPMQESCPYWSSCDRKYQPDLFDCRAFTYCKSGILYKYVCMDNSVYDSVKKICSGRVPCVSYSNKESCKGNLRKNIEYKQDRRKYVYCGEGNAPILLNCTKGMDEIGKVFNPVASTCDVHCTQEGKHSNPDDATNKSYIECLDVNGRYESFTRICPETTTFDGIGKVCTYKNSKPSYMSRITPGGDVCSDGKLPCSLIGYKTKAQYGVVDKNLIFCHQNDVHEVYTYDCGGIDFWSEAETFRRRYLSGCYMKSLETNNRRSMEMVCIKKTRRLFRNGF